MPPSGPGTRDGTPSPGGLHLFKPTGNPCIFVVDAPGMKGQDTLRRGEREIRSLRTCLALCQPLHLLQIREASLQKSQASGQDGLALWPLQQVDEGDPRKKLGVIARERGGKLSQRDMQQLAAALGQLVEMPIGLAFLGDDLPSDGALLFKVLESKIERLIVQNNDAAKRPVDILFNLIAVPWTLPQHGEN